MGDKYYGNAEKKDADLLISIYNAAFYTDYIKYGECPAYGQTRARIEGHINDFPHVIIFAEDSPVGVVSAVDNGEGEYYVACLCVIPEYQGKGIGTQAFRYLLNYCKNWKKITLITPADKEENLKFYTEKCGFRIDGTQMDGNVKVAHFVLEQ
jgi:ribosomal protein S18 acetylase RimI-like enzyme